LDRHEIVCPACRRRIDAREPTRRESVLYAWGRGLMLVLAVFLFLKGAYAALAPKEYERLIGAFGATGREGAALHWNAAFHLLAALLYAIAWAAGYLRRAWDRAACLAALVVFVVGQGVTLFASIAQAGGVARAIALFVFWVSVPIFQYCAFVLGRGPSGPPPAEAAEQAE